ncbi:olfactory receptor 6B9-like [Rhinoderma darwinii]|uniref:olfactory receptor 6B9-like n=1 Tax=Rhinoderma darwinii TaxID=43563 RepID=UPI003F67A589
MVNLTTRPDFIFVGFSTAHNLHIVFFAIFLIVYILTIITNFLIIMIVKEIPNLHTPMYIFIASLSILEICYVSVTTPNMLSIFLVKSKNISFEGCMTQLYVFFSLGCSECFLLTMMAGDRYLAICYPLRYSSLMTTKMCLQLILSCYASGFAAPILTITFVSSLPFCGANQINHFFCDYTPIVKLSCIRTNAANIILLSLTPCLSLVLTCFFLTMASYICIIFTILKSLRGQRKAFSTCVSHLTVVSMFYGTVIFMYIRPRSKYDLNNDKVVSVVYSVVTPLLNPLIYSLRNKEFQKAVQHFNLRNILLILWKSKAL